MKILFERSGPKLFLDPEEVLVHHPMATRTWFIDSRRRSRKAMKMTPKQVMELCLWYEVGGNLVCRSKKTGRELVWNEASMSWQKRAK